MNPTGTAIAVQVRHQTAMDADFAHRNPALALATTVQARLQVYQQLRQQYPNASLTAELVSVQGEQFVVRAQVEIAGQTLATGLGAATQIEEAEDRARLRVLELLGLSPERVAPAQWEVQVVAQTTPVLAASSSDRNVEATSPSIPVTPAIAPELEPEIPAFDAVDAEPDLPPEPRVTQTTPAERNRPKPAAPVATPAELPLLDPEPTPTAPLSAVPTDWSEDLAEIEVELKRLMWTEAEEQAYLLQHFGKRSRALIADYDQLLLFLDHLRSLPTPGLTPTPPAIEPEPEPIRTVSLPPVPTATPITPPVTTPAIVPPAEQPNRSEAMELTSAAVKRLGWTNRQGSDHLRQTYGKASRQQLTTEELLDFLHYLHRLSPPPSSDAVPF